MSKEQLPRQLKCSRCRHHGIIVPQKGHTKFCPFLKCHCWKCYLITERTRIARLQRDLKKSKNKEKPQCSVTSVSVEGPQTTSAPDGVACPSGTSGQLCPQPGGVPERDATTACSPLDLRSRPAAGGESVAGLDGGNCLPVASSEEGSCTPSNAPYIGEFGQTAPLPLIHFPFRMPGHYPSSYTLCPNFLLNMPWLPPAPAGLYNNGLLGPLMFQHLQSGAMHYPPPSEPEPPAELRQFLTLQPPLLPEAFQVGRHTEL